MIGKGPLILVCVDEVVLKLKTQNLKLNPFLIVLIVHGGGGGAPYCSCT